MPIVTLHPDISASPVGAGSTHGFQHRSGQRDPSVRQPPPKGGYDFLACLIESVAAHVPIDLIEALEAAHQQGGNPGYSALSMFCAYVMQFTLNERYANGFLNRLGSDGRLLAMCGLAEAPSEAAYSRFKKKLTAT